MQARKTVAWMVAVVVLLCTAAVFPRLHRVFGPKLFCLTSEIDLNTGRIRHTRFVLFLPVQQRQEETALAKEIAKLASPKLPTQWVEAVVKTGLGDYYPHPVEGKLLASINQFSSIVNARPGLVQTNAAVVAKLAAALQRKDNQEMDANIRWLLDCLPSPSDGR